MSFRRISWSMFLTRTTMAVIATMTRILADPGMKARFESQGAEIVAGNPEVLARLMKEDQVKWGKIIRDKKIAVD